MNASLVTPLLVLFCLISALAQPPSVTYVVMQTVATGTVVAGVEIGGLSGISYNPYTDTFTAITFAHKPDWQRD